MGCHCLSDSTLCRTCVRLRVTGSRTVFCSVNKCEKACGVLCVSCERAAVGKSVCAPCLEHVRPTCGLLLLTSSQQYCCVCLSVSRLCPSTRVYSCCLTRPCSANVLSFAARAVYSSQLLLHSLGVSCMPEVRWVSGRLTGYNKTHCTEVQTTKTPCDRTCKSKHTCVVRCAFVRMHQA